MSAGTEPENVVIKTLARLSNSLHIGRGVDQQSVTPTGWKAHHEAVELMMFSLDNVPEGQQVRLEKKTSNLLRIRSEDDTIPLVAENLTGVIAVDPVNSTVDVQGMCTYEDLVDKTLTFGLTPLVVPHLKTITVGGAVAGVVAESTGFRNGLPHESVLEMDILTGNGEVVTCSPTENADLYRAFPNSYGTLGYAVRLKLELEPVLDYVALRNVRFADLDTMTRVLAEVSETGRFDDQDVDYLDGVVFSPAESYLIMGTQTAEPGPVSDYTYNEIYYRSIQHTSGVARDRLTIRDYIWRWDTDWFWCSREWGAQNPTVRKLWPHDLLRSNVYSRLLELDRRFSIAERLDGRAGRPNRERVAQTVEVTAEKLVDFLDWLFDSSTIEPVWLCPVRLRNNGEDGVAGVRRWPLSPLTTGTTWVDVGFWSSVPADPTGGDAPEGALTMEIEKKLSDLGGHKLLYSESFYTREDVEKLYGGVVLGELKEKFDPSSRFPGLYEKVVEGA